MQCENQSITQRRKNIYDTPHFVVDEQLTFTLSLLTVVFKRIFEPFTGTNLT